MILNIVIVVILRHISFHLNSIYSQLYSTKVLNDFHNSVYIDQETNIAAISINDTNNTKTSIINNNKNSKCEEVEQENICKQKQGCCYCRPRSIENQGKSFCFNFKESNIFNLINEITYEECECSNGYEFTKRKLFQLFFWMYIVVSLIVYKCLHFFLYFFDGFMI